MRAIRAACWPRDFFWSMRGAVIVARVGTERRSLAAAKQATKRATTKKRCRFWKSAAGKNPSERRNSTTAGESHLELRQYDAAIGSAEKAVAIAPENSLYHEWLGRPMERKRDHARRFSARLRLARKRRRNLRPPCNWTRKIFDAAQDLIEFDCAAPGIAGGGEDKAQPNIQQLVALGRGRRALRGGKLQAGEEGFRRGGRGIRQGAGEQAKSADPDFRHRRLFLPATASRQLHGGCGRRAKPLAQPTHARNSTGRGPDPEKRKYRRTQKNCCANICRAGSVSAQLSETVAGALLAGAAVRKRQKNAAAARSEYEAA